MATITLGPYTISASDQTRVVAAYQVAANADLNATATPTQVLAYIQKLTKQQIIATTQAYERQVAEASADAGVTPVVMTG